VLVTPGRADYAFFISPSKLDVKHKVK
jgi:hypothetical protein